MATSINDPEVRAIFEATRAPRSKRVLIDGKPMDVPTPFPSPEDWRDQWIYFLMVDRFNNPHTPPLPTSVPFDGMVGEFRGGSFNGVRAQLCYLNAFGCVAILLSLVLENF